MRIQPTADQSDFQVLSNLQASTIQTQCGSIEKIYREVIRHDKPCGINLSATPSTIRHLKRPDRQVHRHCRHALLSSQIQTTSHAQQSRLFSCCTFLASKKRSKQLHRETAVIWIFCTLFELFVCMRNNFAIQRKQWRARTLQSFDSACAQDVCNIRQINSMW